MSEVAVNPVPFYTVIVLYICMMAVIGFIATKKTNTMQDYFVLSGKAGFIVSGIAYATTQYSMGTFLGTPGTIYNAGYSGGRWGRAVKRLECPVKCSRRTVAVLLGNINNPFVPAL